MFPNLEFGVQDFVEISGGGRFNSPDRERVRIASRLPRFIGMEQLAQRLFADLTIDVVGAGGVGRSLALHLARLHPKALRIVDPAVYKPESLLTQAIAPCDLDQPKATNTARLCKAISPGTCVRSFDGRFQQLALPALLETDVVLLATDNLAAEVAVSAQCRRLGKPLIQASVYGEALVAQVRFLTNAGESAPCLVCPFGTEEWELYYRQAQYSCSGGGEQQSGPGVDTPTMSTSFLCSLAADLAMVQFARHFLGLGADVGDTLVEYCGYTHATTVSPLACNPACPRDHSLWQRLNSSQPLAERSLGDLARSAPLSELPTDLSFTVGGFDFVESAHCCTGIQPIRRFAPAGGPVGKCRQCGRQLNAARLFSKAQAAGAVLGPLLDVPLTALGAEAANWVAVHDAHRTILIC